MRSTKCWNAFNESANFCDGNISKRTSARNGNLTINLRRQVWHNIFSYLASVIIGAIAFCSNIGTLSANADVGTASMQKQLESTIKQLFKETLDEQEELKPLARVGKVTSAALQKKDESNKYACVAKVELFPVDLKNSTDDKVLYSRKSVLVAYSLDVLFDKDKGQVSLNGFEASDSDWVKLCKAAGIQDEEEETAEPNVTNVPTAHPLDIADFIKKQPSMTKLQWKRFIDGNAGKSIVLRDCVITGVEEDDDNENAVIMTISVPNADLFLIEANVTNPKTVAMSAKLSPGTKIGMVTGTLKKLDADSYPMVALQISNTQIVKVEPTKTDHVVKTGEKKNAAMTGSDIVSECEKKPNGYSNAQIESLQKKLAGQTLTFNGGKVSSVLTDSNMDGRVCIIAYFGKYSNNQLAVRAYFPKSETDHLVQTIDEGTHIKLLEGRVIGSEDKPQPLSLPFLTLTDAKIVVSKE